MTENEKYYRELLHKKIQSQFSSFKETLILKNKLELIRDSYEITIKSEIVDLFIPLEWNFSLDEIKCLLHKDNILDDLYNDWMKSDGGIHTIIRDSLEYNMERYKDEYHQHVTSKKEEAHER